MVGRTSVNPGLTPTPLSIRPEKAMSSGEKLPGWQPPFLLVYFIPRELSPTIITSTEGLRRSVIVFAGSRWCGMSSAASAIFWITSRE